MALVFPDYRTPSERARDAKREAEEQKKAAAELSAARQAEIDRRLEIKELFPEISSRDRATTGVVAFAYHLKNLDVMELAWTRIWQRSWDLYVEARENGDHAAELAGKEELDLISHIAARLADTRMIQDDLRKAEAEAS